MRPTTRLPYALSLRLTDRQYRHLVAQATLQEIGLSEVARAALDAHIDAQPDLEGDVAMSYTTLLASIELDQAEEQLRDAGLT